jgi:hypothetical protein
MKILGGFWQVSKDQAQGATGLDIAKGLFASADEELARQRVVFESIRAAYFPRWDRARMWSIEIWGPAGCDRQKKQIRAENGTQLGIIHEICHAVVGSLSHGKTWQRRMEQAAQKAESIGQAKLAEEIRKDVLVMSD